MSARVQKLYKAPWGGTTNLAAVFDLLLKTAVRNHMLQQDMPKRLYIVSDMQFDSCVEEDSIPESFFEIQRKKYGKAGFELPEIVFWNVNGVSGNFPITRRNSNTMIVSGYSPVILEQLLSGEVDPVALLNRVINKPRYQVINA